MSDPRDDQRKQEFERVRERLRRAGLLEEPPPTDKERPDPAELRAAGRRAGRGTPLSEIIEQQRGD